MSTVPPHPRIERNRLARRSPFCNGLLPAGKSTESRKFPVLEVHIEPLESHQFASAESGDCVQQNHHPFRCDNWFWCNRPCARVEWSFRNLRTDFGKLSSIEELFAGRHFDREVIILCVRWYLRFKAQLS